MASWQANGGLTLTGYSLGSYRSWIDVPGVATFAFAGNGDVTAVPYPGVARDALGTVWLRSVLPLVLQAQGTQVLHASAVRVANGVTVALCGKSTAGKSTLAAALMKTCDYELVADDALPFSGDGVTAVALPIPFRLGLRPASAAALDLNGCTDEMEPTPGPLGAIVILHASDVLESPVAVRPAAALGRLMRHAYCFSLDDSKPQLLERYGDLCACVPVYEMNHPREIDRLAMTVEMLDRFIVSR